MDSALLHIKIPCQPARLTRDVARENSDIVCLNFALSWLLYLRQAQPNDDTVLSTSLTNLVGGEGKEQDEINFLRDKAQESKNWSLLSSALLEGAKLEMSSVRNDDR